MTRRFVALLCAALWFGAACGDDAPDPAVTQPTPESAVEAWLEAVDGGDWQATVGLVAETDLVFLIAVDNVLGVSEIQALLTNGVSGPLRAEYWSSFAASFADISGVSLSGIETGDVREFDLRDERFASVELKIPGTLGTTSILAHDAAGAGWTVDVVGTFGPQLIRPLRDIYRDAVASGAHDVLAAMQTLAPSLQAGLTLLGNEDIEIDARAETETLIRLLGTGAP